MLLKVVPSSYTNPYQCVSGFKPVSSLPYTGAYRDETYTGANYLDNSCASLASPDGVYECDMAYGFDTSTLSTVSKALLHSVRFKIQLEAFNASSNWYNIVTEGFFSIICQGREVLRCSLIDGPYTLLTRGTDNRETFDIDLTNLVTIDDLKDFKIRFYIYSRIKSYTPSIRFMGASLNVDYTPVTETILVPHNFTPQFRSAYEAPVTSGTPGSMIADDLSIGGIFLSDSAIYDGQFYNFECPAVLRFCNIRKAYVTFKVFASTGVAEATYGVYTGNNRLEMMSPEVVSNSYQTYTIELPSLAYNWMQDLKFICQGKSVQPGSVFLDFHGIELHILHEEPVYRGHIATGHASNYYNPPLDDPTWPGFHSIERPAKMFAEPTTGTKESYYADLNYVCRYNASVFLLDFNFTSFEGVDLTQAIIDRIDIRVKEYYYYSKKSPIYYVLYLGDTEIGSAQYTPSGDKQVYYTRHITFTGLSLTHEDLSNLKLRITPSNISNGQNCTAFISGPGVDLWAGAGIPEPELPTIVETAVKGDYSKAPDMLFPSENIKPKEEPGEGYVGNLYNDDLDDYAEFVYIPTEAPADPVPGERPYEAVVFSSPTLESLGIPLDANITRVILTEEGYVYSNNGSAEADVGVYINDVSYSSKPFNNRSTFARSTFDTGEMSYPRLGITDDVLTFQIRWYSLDSDFMYRVKYLLWDITYEVGRFSYTVRFNQDTIDKIRIGQTEAAAAYIGDFKIYG